MASKLPQLFSSVMRQDPELIGAARPTPRVIKELSDIDDQESLRFHVPFLLFYKNNPSPSMIGKDPVKVIREALSRTLVSYYPLAGRIREGPARKLMVDCNNEGAFFIEADANFKLEHLGNEIQPPFPYLDEVLYNVPGFEDFVDCPLLLIQVTRLLCGGFILALKLNHTVWDASGLLQFLKALVEMTGGADEPSLQPVWQREILSARAFPHVTCTHNEYEEIHVTNNDLQTTNATSMDHKSFYFGPKEITALRNLLPPHLKNCTTFELVTACLWKCRTAALELGPDETVRVSCAVSVRGKRYNMHIPAGYYGNTFAFPAECSKAQILCENQLGYAVELVKKVKAQMSEEYIRSVADLNVINGRLIKYKTKGNFIVSDLSRAGLLDIDLGWGKPVYAGPAGAISIISFYVKLHKREGEDGIVVPICLPFSTMEKFEEELKKMTQGEM